MQQLLAVQRMHRGILAAVLVCLIPAHGFAQDVEAAKTSRLTGADLPTGAQRVLKKEFTADAIHTLEAFAKQLGKECASPEILLWNGASKPATETAVKSVTEQLEKAGYECKVLDAPQGLPPVLKKLLLVKNRKQAVLGFWAATDEMVTLAWCQVEKYEAKPVDAEAPAGASPEPDRLPAFPALELKPGLVRGMALSMAGKPLARAEITIRGTTMAGERTWFTVKTDEKGYYELPLPAGVYKLSSGTWETRYGGMLYKLPLRTIDASYDSVSTSKGHIGNWVLQVRGQVPDTDLMYGGYVLVQIADGKRAKDVGWAPGSVVLVVLTPVGPLIDGSQIRPIATKFEIPQPSFFDTSSLFTIPGVPVGQYTVSAHLVAPGGGARALSGVVTVFREGIGDDVFPIGGKPLYLHPKANRSDGVTGARIDLKP